MARGHVPSQARSSTRQRTEDRRPVRLKPHIPLSSRASSALQHDRSAGAGLTAGDVMSLQRTAGNRAVTGVLQRNGHGAANAQVPGLDPAAAAVRQSLDQICAAGEKVAWDLYRAVLEIQAAIANERYQRMSTDSDIQGVVLAAQNARAQAEQTFARLRAEGDQHLRAAQAEAAKDAPDQAALSRHISDLYNAADSAAQAMKQVSESAWKTALRAEEQGRLVAARYAFRAADQAEGVLDLPRPVVRITRANQQMDARTAIYNVGIDTAANTLGGGTYGNIITGVTLDATSGSTMANVGMASSAVLGPLAVLCGSINLAVDVAAVIKTTKRVEELERLRPLLADPNARAVASYAIEQKEKKQQHRVVSGSVAVAGVAAGIAATVTIGVATFGVGALVIGVFAASAGFGLLAYRIYRKSDRARKGKLKEFAKELVKTAADANADPADRDHARAVIRNLRVAPANDDFSQTNVRALRDALFRTAMSERDMMATALLHLLVNGRRSERRDATLLLSALKLDPDELSRLATNGQSGEAHGRIAGKLASW